MKLLARIYLVGSGSNGFDLTDPLDCHVYLVDGGAEAALIDAGAGPGALRIVENVRASGVDPVRVRHLLLTHAHADHAGGAGALRRLLPGLRVYVHRDGAKFVREGDEHGISLDVGKRAGYYPPAYRFEPCAVDVELVEGQQIRIGDLTVTTVESPGHCAGHVAYVIHVDGRRVLVSGDSVFWGGRIFLQNIYDCDLQASVRSVQRLAALDIDVLLPGHQGISLQDGRRHLTLAAETLRQGRLPPQLM